MLNPLSDVRKRRVELEEMEVDVGEGRERKKIAPNISQTGAMSLLSWNCHGLGNPRAVRALKKLNVQKDPTILFLMESRKNDFEVKNMRSMGNYHNVVAVSCSGEGRTRSGGLSFVLEERG